MICVQVNSFIRLCIFLGCLANAFIDCQLITGNEQASEGQSFSFGLQKNVQGFFTAKFYVGAHPGAGGNGDVNEFAIAQVSRGNNKFVALAPQTITLNNVAQQNPLFDQGILALDLFGKKELPLIVTENEPTIVYLFDQFPSPENIHLVSAQKVRDSIANVSAGVVSLASSRKAHVFAAVKPQGGDFGDDNSGIALFVRDFITVEEDGEQKKFRTFFLVDAPTGRQVQNPRAIQLDTRSTTVAIDNRLSNIENVVDMHWDQSSERLYIALQVTAGNNGNDGARAVVVGRLGNNNQLILSSIVPNDAIQANNNIIAARGANEQVSIHKVKTMFTTTALHYLIVVGGNGAPDGTQKSVFALPLVSGVNSSAGLIADKDAVPQDTFSQKEPFRIIARNIMQAATQPNQMIDADNIAARVGGGNLAAGNISDIIVRGDTVFALVFQDNNDKQGVYYSQALFEANGKIKGWTQWQRAVGTVDQIFGAALDPADGSFTLMSGNDENTVNMVKRTVWAEGRNEGLQPLQQALSDEFPQTRGGIQGLCNFLPVTPGLNNISLAIATGLSKVAIIQTGMFDDVLVPSKGNDFNNVEWFENGAITGDVASKTVIISGGVLDELGPIVAAEVARDGSNGWLFVGGTDGLAVLSQENGDGWDINYQLGDNLAGLVNGMAFKRVGDYSFVKKLVHDGNFLYVLTDIQLDRIDLTRGNVGIGDILSVTLATNNNFVAFANTGGFIDCVISGSFGLLATTAGLFRVGNGSNITTAMAETEVLWTPVMTPGGIASSIQLLAVSQSGRCQDVAKNAGGHVYVLSAHQGTNQARVNRFAIDGIDNNAVQANTIQPFTDLFVENIPAFLLNFGTFEQRFMTDGALYFVARSQGPNRSLGISATSTISVPRAGVAGVGNRSMVVPIEFASGTQITGLERNVGSGSWLLSGDFGLRVHE